MARTLAVVVEQPKNLLGEPAFAVLLTDSAGRVTIAGMYTDREAAELAAAALNPKPRPVVAPSPQLQLF